jgi:Transcriptional regulators
MTEFEENLNLLLTDTYNNITKVEEDMLRASGIQTTISEIHLIDAIGRSLSPTVSNAAAHLSITLASVTVAVNKLMERGFLTKEKNPDDGRSVHLKLTQSGKRAFRLHRYFHRKMVQAILHGLSESEAQAIYTGVNRLNEFFIKSAKQQERLL